MAEPKRKSDVSEAPVAPTTASGEARSKRAFTDPLTSSRGGLGGIAETILRRFKSLSHFLFALPLYSLAALIMGLAAAPGLAAYEWISTQATLWPFVPRMIATGFAFAAAYFIYGFTLIFVVPAVNFALRGNLKTWRGPYYSLEAIRWYIHNGATYLVRYTFLEFLTPSPFNILFFKMMGMKIGRGTTINSSCLSDPSMIELGEKVTIGGSATIVAHYGQGGYLVLAPTKIGDGATIGLRATIMGGVTIGEGAKILPNSVVLPKTVVPAGETWGGVPARKLDLRTDLRGRE